MSYLTAVDAKGDLVYTTDAPDYEYQLDEVIDRMRLKDRDRDHPDGPIVLIRLHKGEKVGSGPLLLRADVLRTWRRAANYTDQFIEENQPERDTFSMVRR